MCNDNDFDHNDKEHLEGWLFLCSWNRYFLDITSVHLNNFICLLCRNWFIYYIIFIYKKEKEKLIGGTRSFKWNIHREEAFLTYKQMAAHLDINTWRWTNLKDYSFDSCVDIRKTPSKNWPLSRACQNIKLIIFHKELQFT